MKWLTISQIKRRSKTAKGALKVSCEHWCQLYDATAKELRAAYEKGKVKVTQDDCGLCELYFEDACDGCPLGDCSHPRTLYRKARWALDDWLSYKEDKNWQDWKRACKALRDKLGELLK